MRIPNSGQCFPGKLDYHAAQVFYEKQDADKSGSINFGGAYAALSKLEPTATEAQLSKLTNDPKTGILRRGKVSYITFLSLYRTLHAETHKENNSNPCAKNPCDKGQSCRRCKNTKGFCCTAIVTAKPNTAKLTHSERAQVNNIFTALNTDHTTKTLSKAEFGELLNAVTQDLDRTHNIKLYKSVTATILAADKNDDGVVDYVEFVRACVALKAADAKDFHEFLKSAEKLKPLKIGSVCIPFHKESVDNKACPKGSTCQQAPVPTGKKVVVRRYTCKKNVALTKGEKAQVGNIYGALDIDHNNKLSHTEMYGLLHVIRSGLDQKSAAYQREYEAITRSVYYNADANKDKYVSRAEFYKAISALKNADPQDFHVFMKAAHGLYPLHVGNVCLPFKPVGDARPCPHGSTCQIKQVATTKKPKNAPTTKYVPAYRRSTPTPSVYHCVKNKALTTDERHRVFNVFTALDKNHDGKLAHYTELYQLLRTIRGTFSYYTPEYQAISHSVYYDADTNKDGYVTRTEYLNAMTTLKNANPVGFPGFLKACEKLKPLHVGDPCQASKYAYNYQACPKGATCQLKKTKPVKTTPHPSKYTVPVSTCVKDKALTKREKAQANNIFHALDVNHDKKISRTEMYDLLHVVSDWAQTNNNHNLYLAVDRSVYTSYSDTNKDSYVEYNEFIAAVQKLKNMDPIDFPKFLTLSKQIRPLKIGDECKPYRSNKNDGACPAHSTCAVDLKHKTTTKMPHQYVARTYKCVKDLQLTKTERRRVFNLFSALDAKHEKKLDAGEMARLLQGVRSALDSKKYAALIEAISRSTYFSKDDLNKDNYVEFNEFVVAMTQVKNRDPKDFGVFLNAAKTIKPLKTGDVCRPNGSGDACPKKQTCQLTQKASGSPYIRRDGPERQMIPRALAAKTTKGTGGGSKPFGPPSYKAPKYQCRKDVSLTKDERTRVGKLFHAMDKSNDHKLSSTEYSSLMHQVYEESRKTKDYSLQTAIYESAYYTVSDANKDHYVELGEFINGCTKLKNRDPKDFKTFLSIASRIKKLKVGQGCTNSYFATSSCPAGTTCRLSNNKYQCVSNKPNTHVHTTKDPWAFPNMDGDVVHVHG